ncbi:MAG: ThiF family adenylyltransferase [Candidatus Brocadiales bacterium]|nr:ThiF family adenylyltransferase [Candidatus Bathyanammoxibius amoris]
MINRYSRQILFQPIGVEGQKRLSRSCALVIGCGATGSASAGTLARAGVGRLRIVDRDFLEETNLQRQSLFDEEDLKTGLPKAALAEKSLGRINSSIKIEGVVADANPSNIETLAAGADVILDCTDNFETRYLINDYAVKTRTPWVYAACVGSQGMLINIIPGETPCLRCLLESRPPVGTTPTCETAGILGPTAQLISSIQANEALKILTGHRESLIKDLLKVDTWTWTLQRLDLSDARQDECPACGLGRYDFLHVRSGVMTTTLCGNNAVQIVPPNGMRVKLEELASRLNGLGELGEVTQNPFLLRFRLRHKDIAIAVFPDGRAIIQGTKEPALAKDLYSKYIGM